MREDIQRAIDTVLSRRAGLLHRFRKEDQETVFNFEMGMEYVTLVADCDVGEIADNLTQPDEVAPNGVSFAFTSDAPRGQRHLWLTRAARQRVIEHRDLYLRCGLNPDGLLDINKEGPWFRGE